VTQIGGLTIQRFQSICFTFIRNKEELEMKNKFSIAMSLAVILAMLLTSLALADTIQTDGDTLVASLNPSVSDCTVQNTFSGSSTISYAGGQHFASGATLTVTVTADLGISASGPATTTLPMWDSNGDAHVFSGISTTVPAGISSGTYKVNVEVTGPKAGTGGGTHTASDFFNVNVTCASTPSNTAPTIAADNASVTFTEGATAANTGTFSDADNDTVTLAASVGAVTDNLDGTWSWSFDTTDGPAESQLVTITADDGQAQATATFSLTVQNANPAVTASWASASVACRQPATLNFGFSDAGAIDNPWTVDIDWGDSSSHYYDNTVATQGTSSQTHAYNMPGAYTATVGVTDKDTGSGSATAVLNVLQSYTVNFLQPFDNSSPSQLVTNTMKSGRTVPVKVTIYDDCAQAYVTDPATLVRIGVSTVTNTSTGANDGIEVYADAGASNGNTAYFRWTSDAGAPGGGFWIYNLDSRTVLNGSALAINTTYRVDVFVGAVKATNTKWALLKPVK
jgi:hypothetical protein